MCSDAQGQIKQAGTCSTTKNIQLRHKSMISTMPTNDDTGESNQGSGTNYCHTEVSVPGLSTSNLLKKIVEKNMNW